MSLTILDGGIIKQNEYFVTIPLELTVLNFGNFKGINGHYYIANNGGIVDIIVDPITTSFELDLKTRNCIKSDESLGKISTINIINYNIGKDSSIKGKKFIVDYVFAIISDRTKNYFKQFDDKFLTQNKSKLVNNNDFYYVDNTKLINENTSFFNPFYIWSKDKDKKTIPKDFYILNKELFDFKEDIDVSKHDNYTLRINDTLLFNILDTLENTNKFKSSNNTQIVIPTKADSDSDKKKKENWIIIFIIAIVFIVIISIIIGIAVHKHKEKQRLQQSIRSKI